MDNNILFCNWLGRYFEEVTPREFYRGIFPPGELDEKEKFTKGKYTGIAIEVTREKKNDGKPKIKRYCITDDLETIDELGKSDNFCLCSPISYCGKERTANNSRFMYAIAIDLDRIIIKNNEPLGLIGLFNHIDKLEWLPRPTYIVSSGTGLHLYYVLEKAIPLFNNTAKELQALKHDLTAKVWHGTIVNIRHENEIQQEGIYQGFRIPGTITKNGSRARAFLTGKKVTLEYLNNFVDDKNQVVNYTVKKAVPLAKAKELYPEWYEKRIKNKEPRGVWHISRNLYDWWLREIKIKATLGHRYYCLMILSMYAYKCSMYDAKHNPNPVTREELERDCWELKDLYDVIEAAPFTDADVLDALEAYDNKWITYPRNSIEFKCGFTIPKNKRNKLKQNQHLTIARTIKQTKKTMGIMKQEGRPKGTTKQNIIEQWQQSNPHGTITECAKALNISRTTIYKYWNNNKG